MLPRDPWLPRSVLSGSRSTLVIKVDGSLKESSEEVATPVEKATIVRKRGDGEAMGMTPDRSYIPEGIGTPGWWQSAPGEICTLSGRGGCIRWLRLL